MTQHTQTLSGLTDSKNAPALSLEMNFPFTDHEDTAQMTKRSRRHRRLGRRWDACGF